MMPETTFAISDQVIAREVGDETILLDLEHGTYYGLDPVGARIWDLLKQGASLDEVCSIIVNEYDVDRATVECDVSELCDSLMEEKLIAANA